MDVIRLTRGEALVVEFSFGTLDGDSIASKVPMKGEDGTDGHEAMQVEHGGK